MSGNTGNTMAAPIQPTTLVATNAVHDPLAASAAVPGESTESPERHGSTSSPPQQTAHLEVAPEPAPAPAAAALPIEPAKIAEPEEAAVTAPAPQYWVEYGVFTGARAAKRLQQELAGQGLDTTITSTHAPDGRPLLRVRSPALLDYGAAKAASATARQGLRLSALLHRNIAAPAAAAVALGAPTSPSANHNYWVQFGAFLHHHQAAKLQEELARGGVDTAISTMHGTSGRTLYWVRSLNLADRDSAVAMADRGKAAGSTDFLVGQSNVHSLAGGEPKHADDDTGSRSVPYHAAESLPFPAR
jgi:cell division protein FtsN